MRSRPARPISLKVFHASAGTLDRTRTDASVGTRLLCTVNSTTSFARARVWFCLC